MSQPLCEWKLRALVCFQPQVHTCHSAIFKVRSTESLLLAASHGLPNLSLRTLALIMPIVSDKIINIGEFNKGLDYIQ